MGDAGIDPASQRAYYLPDAPGVGNHDEQRYANYDAATDSSTVHEHIDRQSLSGTTQASEQADSPPLFKPDDDGAHNTLNGRLELLPQADLAGRSAGDFVSLFNDNVYDPSARGTARPYASAIDPRLHRDAITNHSGNDSSEFVDFVHQTQYPISIHGRFEATFDLDILTLLGPQHGGFVRQWTPGDDLLCGLYALVISLNAMLEPTWTFTVPFLQAILAGSDYHNMCMLRIRQLASGSSPLPAESLELLSEDMFAPRNLSVEQLTYLVYLVGQRINRPLQLGVVASTSAETDGQPCRVYTACQFNCNDNAGAMTIWLVNESFGGEALNHWSGLAPAPAHLQASHARVANDAPQRQRQPDVQTAKHKTTNKRTRKVATGPPRKTHALTAEEPMPPPLPLTVAGGIFCPHLDCKNHSSAANPKPFKTKRALNHHRNTVHRPHGQRKHVCKICQRSFNYPKDRVRHETDVHYKNHPQWCLVEDCGMYGDEHRQRGRNLWRHYQSMHGGQPEAWELCRLQFDLGEKGQPNGGKGATSPTP